MGGALLKKTDPKKQGGRKKNTKTILGRGAVLKVAGAKTEVGSKWASLERGGKRPRPVDWGESKKKYGRS